MLSKDPSVKSMEDWSEQFVWLKVDGGRWNKLTKTEKEDEINNAKLHGNNGWKNSVHNITWTLSANGQVEFTVSGMNEYGMMKACLLLANGTFPIMTRKFTDHPNHIQTGSPCTCKAVVNGCYNWDWKKISA